VLAAIEQQFYPAHIITSAVSKYSGEPAHISTKVKLEDLGYNDTLEKFRVENNLKDFEIGRVISEHKERYITKTEKGEFEAEITGHLRFSAKSREDFPAVGDWVATILIFQ
jgi:hypothetical protein